MRGITGAATNSYVPAYGQTFEIVTAQGGVQGNFASVLQHEAATAVNVRFDVLYQPNAIRLMATPGNCIRCRNGK